MLREYAARIDDPFTSILATVEVPRAVRRSDPSGVPRVAEVLEPLQLIEIDEPILEQARRLDPPDLGSADAIHLASALRLGDDVSAFVTYDNRLRRAAAWNGVFVSSIA